MYQFMYVRWREVSKKSNDNRMGLLFGPVDYEFGFDFFINISLSIYTYMYICVYIYMYIKICATAGMKIKIEPLNSCSLSAAKIQRSDSDALYS